jgi:hypothetical protein
MNPARRKMTAWIAVAALLFSALSPAMASVLFSDRPDILARVLGASAAPVATADDDGCPHDASAPAQHGKAGQQPDDASGHVAHGIYCSFCLAASAVVTLPGAANAAATDVITVPVYIPGGHIRPPAASPAATRHPRDPPLALR